MHRRWKQRDSNPIWRQSRIAGLLGILAGVAAGFAVQWLYDQLGYVKLLGLPHILLWTPYALYLVAQIRRPDMPVWPRRIMMVVLATILISLAFDYVDVARYLLGERTPFPALAGGSADPGVTTSAGDPA